MSELNTQSLARTLAAIEALDLGPIKFKAMRRDDGYGWSSAYADAMERSYKRYLMLHAMHPELTLAPDQDTDRFWHMHILDTRKYAADCEATFGHFLHHYPYLGLRGEDDEKALAQAFATMQALYRQAFGEPMPQARADKAAWCGAEAAMAPAWCGAETDEKAGATAAWCGIESPPQRAAWCGLEPAAAGGSTPHAS